MVNTILRYHNQLSVDLIEWSEIHAATVKWRVEIEIENYWSLRRPAASEVGEPEGHEYVAVVKLCEETMVKLLKKLERKMIADSIVMSFVVPESQLEDSRNTRLVPANKKKFLLYPEKQSEVARGDGTSWRMQPQVLMSTCQSNSVFVNTAGPLTYDRERVQRLRMLFDPGGSNRFPVVGICPATVLAEGC